MLGNQVNNIIDLAFEPKILEETPTPILEIPRTKTIRVLLFRDDEVFLVKEKPDPIINGIPGKSEGWGLCGGGVKDNPNLIHVTVKRLMVEAIIKSSDFTMDDLDIVLQHDTEDTGMETLKDFITAVIEAFDETGYLVDPERWLFKNEQRSNQIVGGIHETHVVTSRIVAGKPKKTSNETTDSGWFHLSALPVGTYWSHADMIKRSLRELGRDDSVVRVLETKEEK